MQMPTEDRYLLTVDELTDRMAVMLGGRAAELTVLGTISTGASDDILKATELARRMVTEFGMSEKLGSVRYAGQQLQYLGGMVQDNSQLSPQTQEIIDTEVQTWSPSSTSGRRRCSASIAGPWSPWRKSCWSTRLWTAVPSRRP